MVIDVGIDVKIHLQPSPSNHLPMGYVFSIEVVIKNLAEVILHLFIKKVLRLFRNHINA